MAAFDILESRWALQDPTISLNGEEYQSLCVAINALPAEEQAQWDETVLNFTYQGKPIQIADLPKTSVQGGLE